MAGNTGGMYVPNPTEFVREIALDVGLNSNATKLDIVAALEVMNRVIAPTILDKNSIVSAAEAFELPKRDWDVENLTEEDIRQRRILDIMARGSVDSIQWFGSVTVSGFGLRMFGVEFYQPKRKDAEVLYVPVETLSLHIAA